ncbi:MAG: glycoside hydrolase family 15 protein [Marmoricola sp.]
MTAVTDLLPETLRQYALIADGERGAVVGPRGEIAFLCAPSWHSPAVFSSLIGGGGHYVVTPSDARFVWGGYYEEGSLIWRSRWVTTDGVVECREALAFPGDRDRLVLLRRIEAVEGTARLRLVLHPRADFGHATAQLHSHRPGEWSGETGPLHVRWSGAPDSARLDGSAVTAEVEVAAGQHHDLVLEISSSELPTAGPDAGALWAETEAAWRREIPHLHDSIAPDDVRHSFAVLRGLTGPGRGTVAAATMSLPERAEAGRNYDYRYSWIRDQCYVGQSAAVAGGESLLRSSVDFVTARLLHDGPNLKPAYTNDGGTVPDERSLDLAGYPGGSDKVGNWVNHQFQLDALGETLLLLAANARRGDPTPGDQKAAELAAEVIAQHWQQPDAGIWELDNRHWTHSKLICAAGLRAYAGAVPGPDQDRWRALAEAIVVRTNATSRHPTGRWQRAPDDQRVDAALLLAGLRGAVPVGDSRTTATVAAVREELEREGYVYRFRHDERPLSEAEGAFLLCGFHLAMASHQQGDEVAAVRGFERNRSAIGPPGLMNEEFDIVQRQLRGNLPQAFVHALLIESAVRLDGPPSRQEDIS